MPGTEQPHPLAIEFASQLRHTPALLVGIGSGRNLPALTPRGELIAVDEDPARIAKFRSGPARCLHCAYDALPLADASIGGIISTHVLQHGSPTEVRGRVAEIARVARSGALFYAAFGSQSDARYGVGAKIADWCYAPTEGDEIGVAHTYWTKIELANILERQFALQSIEDTAVDSIVGRWAHASLEPRTTIVGDGKHSDGINETPNTNFHHFFVRALRR